MKAGYLLKQNVDALLSARKQTRHDLAQFCRRSDAWLSKILGKDDRNIPLKYLDRMADFFGLATYQLFQPGISPLTERRKGGDRRSGRDRRVAARVPDTIHAGDLPLTREDIALLLQIKSLSRQARADVRRTVERMASATRRGLDAGIVAAAPVSLDEPVAAAHVPHAVSRPRRGR